MAIINLQVGANGDDGHWFDGSSSFSNSLPGQGMGWGAGGAGSLNSFARFISVTIPQGATINSAVLKFNPDDNYSSTTVNLRISAIDADNAAAPTDYNEANTATLTTAKVDWDNVASWSIDAETSSPDISSVIQEIIDRGSWSSGNALVIMIKDNVSTTGGGSVFRESDTHNSSSSLAMKLDIDYTTGDTDLNINVSDSILIEDIPHYPDDTIIIGESVQISIVASTDLSISVSDSISIAENVEANNAFLITVSDSITISESTNFLLTSYISVSDSISIAENINATLVFNLSVSDSISIAESVSVDEPALVIHVSETITITDRVRLFPSWIQQIPTEDDWAQQTPTSDDWTEQTPTEAAWTEQTPTEGDWTEQTPTEDDWEKIDT